MYRILKNLIDRITSLGLIFILSPLFLFLMFVVALQNKGNPIFTQIRTGEKGVLFKIYKFKTMRDTRDAAGELLPDFDRATPLGKIIRQLSLDELRILTFIY